MINSRQWRYLLGLYAHGPRGGKAKNLPPLSRTELEGLLAEGYVIPNRNGYTLTEGATAKIGRGESLYKQVQVDGRDRQQSF